MGKKYIIELLDDCPSEFKGIIVFGLTPDGQISAEPIPVEDLTPYTEPDLEQVRQKAYKEGVEDGKRLCPAPEVCNDMAYQKGLSDAWYAARKIVLDTGTGGIPLSKLQQVFHKDLPSEIIGAFSASEAIEEIRAYEQAQKELEQEQNEEKPIRAEDVMRQYLDTFCKRNFCTKCLLHTPDFTCGRGYHFLTKNPVSDEEVRRAYATVLAKMKE